MKISTTVIAIVTSYNDVDVIDRTITSLRCQTISHERFYIVAVDFGSTDGTYEKLLAYDRYHMGVYQVTENIRPEQYPARAEIFASRVTTNDEKYYFLLRAGDTVIPETSEYCSDLLEKYKAQSPVMLIGEADAENADGSITNVSPLFSEAFILDGARDPMELTKRGHNHRVFCMVYLPDGDSLYRSDVSYRGIVPNDRTKWNNLFYTNYRRNSLYVPKVMANLRNCPAADIVFSLASNYAMLLYYVRHSQSMYSNTLRENEYALAFRNLAQSALYNACLEFSRNNTKKAEDCLLFSSVVDPSITSDRLFVETAFYLSGQGSTPFWEPDGTLLPPHGAVRIDI